VSPTLGGDSPATVLVAATGVADNQLSGFRIEGIVTTMNCLAHATCMRRGGRGRHEERAQSPDQPHKYQNFGYQTAHAELKVGKLINSWMLKARSGLQKSRLFRRSESTHSLGKMDCRI